MIRRTLVVVVAFCLLAGIAQARNADNSRVIVPQSDFNREFDQPPTIIRHDPPDRGGRPDSSPPIGVPKSDFTREQNLPLTITRHDPPDRGLPGGYDPISWGVWMLMKSFGGGN